MSNIISALDFMPIIEADEATKGELVAVGLSVLSPEDAVSIVKAASKYVHAALDPEVSTGEAAEEFQAFVWTFTAP